MIRYLVLEEVLDLHRRTLEQSGGSEGVRDLGGLDSALAQPQWSEDEWRARLTEARSILGEWGHLPD